MTGIMRKLRAATCRTVAVAFALLLGACSLKAGKLPPGAAAGGEFQTSIGARKEIQARPAADHEIADLSRIPQELDGLAAAAGNRLTIGDACREQLRDEFQSRFFAPWNAPAHGFDPAESRDFMAQEGRAAWYGVNKQKVAPKQMRELMANCALESFPSRNDTAISVAPGHLRGLPSYLPLYQSSEGYPFDMLSYPQVKLNEPLRVLHASRDGAWLFVETGYSDGWLETRDVALVDRGFIDSWIQAPHLVVVRDLTPVPDGRGVGMSLAKVGTILPLAQAGDGWWEVAVASAADGGQAQIRPVRIPREAAAPFPLAFSRENVAMVGNQLLGEPYGWGEAYDLRDCSALLRDFFLPFGIWLPRTSTDQVASVPQRIELARMTPPEKEDLIRSKGVPFLTLLYKPGHIMLYVGLDAGGRPLVFHDAWSVRLKGASAENGATGSAQAAGANGENKVRNGPEPCAACSVEGSGERTKIIGVSAITTLEPGKELGLVPGGSLLEKGTEFATITNRCLK